jgi:hypothetical protein
MYVNILYRKVLKMQLYNRTICVSSFHSVYVIYKMNQDVAAKFIIIIIYFLNAALRIFKINVILSRRKTED